MKKVGCAKCGGTMNKMAKGGSTTNKLNNPKGYAPAQKGGDNTKMGIYGVPNAGRTDSLGFKKGGSVKMQNGGLTGEELKYKGQLMNELGVVSKNQGAGLAGQGQAMKARGKAMKAKGQIMKAEGKTLKSASEILKRKKMASEGKAKFGATVNVQRGYPGKIRSANDQGYTAIGKREPARTKFAKGGTKFPDLTGDGKVTKADVLKGRGVIKKMGGSIKKK